jgi:undecaprenyl phosphate N,N'-diacetylbacillosamine 1-phosphate transferase
MLKFILDKSLSLVLLIIFMPLMLFLLVFIRLKLGSPAVFTQSRPGRNEKIFTIYKFRTMTDAKDKVGNLLPDEVRLTKFGKFLRSTSLDELPQLLNILKGDMSFVGPRALLIEYLPLYNTQQKKRHLVKPGITGWAQINGRNAISWEQKFEYDVWYVENSNFWLDIKILWFTALKVIKRSDISQGGHVTMEKFKGSHE